MKDFMNMKEFLNPKKTPSAAEIAQMAEEAAHAEKLPKETGEVNEPQPPEGLPIVEQANTISSETPNDLFAPPTQEDIDRWAKEETERKAQEQTERDVVAGAGTQPQTPEQEALEIPVASEDEKSSDELKKEELEETRRKNKEQEGPEEERERAEAVAKFPPEKTIPFLYQIFEKRIGSDETFEDLSGEQETSSLMFWNKAKREEENEEKRAEYEQFASEVTQEMTDAAAVFLNVREKRLETIENEHKNKNARTGSEKTARFWEQNRAISQDEYERAMEKVKWAFVRKEMPVKEKYLREKEGLAKAIADEEGKRIFAAYKKKYNKSENNTLTDLNNEEKEKLWGMIMDDEAARYSADTVLHLAVNADLEFEQMKAERILNAQEKGIMRKLLGEYATMPRWKKIATGAAIAGIVGAGVALTFGTGGIAGAGALGGARILRSLGGGTLGVSIQKGAENLFINKKYEKQRDEAFEKQRVETLARMRKMAEEMEGWLENDADAMKMMELVDKDARNLGGDIQRIGAKEKKTKMWTGLAAGLAGGLTAAGVDQWMHGKPVMGVWGGSKEHVQGGQAPVESAGMKQGGAPDAALSGSADATTSHSQVPHYTLGADDADSLKPSVSHSQVPHYTLGTDNLDAVNSQAAPSQVPHYTLGADILDQNMKAAPDAVQPLAPDTAAHLDSWLDKKGFSADQVGVIKKAIGANPHLADNLDRAVTVPKGGNISQALHHAMGPDVKVTVINPDGTKLLNFDANLVHPRDTVLQNADGAITVVKTSGITVHSGDTLASALGHHAATGHGSPAPEAVTMGQMDQHHAFESLAQPADFKKLNISPAEFTHGTLPDINKAVEKMKLLEQLGAHDYLAGKHTLSAWKDMSIDKVHEIWAQARGADAAEKWVKKLSARFEMTGSQWQDIGHKGVEGFSRGDIPLQSYSSNPAVEQEIAFQKHILELIKTVPVKLTPLGGVPETVAEYLPRAETQVIANGGISPFLDELKLKGISLENLK